MNAVDMDKEIANMAQNELQYTVGAMLLQRHFEGCIRRLQSK